jgi:hypothetical protein
VCTRDTSFVNLLDCPIPYRRIIRCSKDDIQQANAYQGTVFTSTDLFYDFN